MSQGFKSLLAFWIGGANKTVLAGPKGYRSLLAYWIGGATVPSTTPPPPPHVGDGRSSLRLSRMAHEYLEKYGLNRRQRFTRNFRTYVDRKEPWFFSNMRGLQKGYTNSARKI